MLIKRLSILFAIISLAACASLPNKSMISLNGHAVAYAHQGNASPTVIFESGLGHGMDAWDPIFTDVASFATVFAYDRSGYGDSEPVDTPRTGAQIVAELKELLEKTNVEPPYILVGHSLGGLYMMLFAKTYPADVAGIVLVDATTENRSSRFAARFPEEQTDADRERINKAPSHIKREYRGVKETERQVQEAGTFGDIPAIILTAVLAKENEPLDERTAFWVELQAEQAAKFVTAEHIVAWGSGHFIQHDKPDLVINSIDKLVQGAKGQSSDRQVR